MANIVIKIRNTTLIRININHMMPSEFNKELLFKAFTQTASPTMGLNKEFDTIHKYQQKLFSTIDNSRPTTYRKASFTARKLFMKKPHPRVDYPSEFKYSYSQK